MISVLPRDTGHSAPCLFLPLCLWSTHGLAGPCWQEPGPHTHPSHLDAGFSGALRLLKHFLLQRAKFLRVELRWVLDQ